MLCFFKAQEIKTAYTSQSYNTLEVNQAAVLYSEYGSALRDFVETHLTHRCDLVNKLACLDLPAMTANVVGGLRMAQSTPTAADYILKIDTLNTLWLEVLRDCFCSALLPPCVGPEPTDCIPLAVLTVNVDKCQVIEICNWSARKFALTLPSIFYWTSFINWGAIKEAIARLCCGTADQRLWETLFSMMERSASANAGATTSPQMMEVRAASAPGAPAGMTTTTGTTSTTTTTAASPLHTFNALVGFLEQATHPDGMANLISGATPAGQQTDDITSLRRTVDALHKRVNDQATQIEELRKR
jgi:hypothetical protein